MPMSPSYQSPMVPTWKVRSALTSTPALAVTLAEVKAPLKITNALEDDYLTLLATAAQETAQLWTGRIFTTATMVGKADNPLSASSWWEGVREMPAVAIFGNPRGLELPGVPLVSVQTFTFTGIDQVVYTFDASNQYYVDTTDKDRPGRIVLRYTTTYPGVPKEILAIGLTYTVGYGAAAAVPSALKLAIIRLTTYLYANPGDCGGDPEDLVTKSGAKTFLQLYKVYNI